MKQIINTLIVAVALSMALNQSSARIILVPDSAATIQAAVDSCSDGDTVEVSLGEYSGEGFYSITPRRSKILIRSQKGSDHTWINVDDSTLNAFDLNAFDVDADSNIVIEGFTIRGARIGINISTISGAVIIDVAFINNVISGIYNQTEAYDEAWPKYVKSCQFIQNGNGILPSPNTNYFGTYYIDGCIFRDCSGTAITLGELNSMIIVNSDFSNNQTGINSLSTFISAWCTIQNCTFIDNYVAVHGVFEIVNSIVRGGSIGLKGVEENVFYADNCTFENIDTTAIVATGCLSSVKNSTFNNNSGSIANITSITDSGYSCQLIFNKCNFSNNIGGIELGSSRKLLSIFDCIYENSGSINLVGEYEGYIKIDGCVFFNNSDTLINISTSECRTDISNSIFHHNNFVIRISDSANIYNNTITNNSGDALIADDGDIHISRNVISFNDGYGFTKLCNEFIDFDISNCNFFENGAGNYNCINDKTEVAGNISSDPLFCDTSNSDYNISWWSPCSPYMNDSGLIGALGIGCENPNYENLVSIYIDPPDTIISCHDSLQFEVKGIYVDSSEGEVSAWVDWATSNPMIASIDSNGLVWGENIGICSLITQLVDFSDTSSLTVKPNIDHEEMVIPVLDTSRCSLTVTVSGNPEVYLFYRPGGEVEYDSLPMQLSDTSLVGIIPEDIMGLRSLDYYFRATENEISATLPEYNPEDEPFILRLEFSEQQGTALPGGVYRMIGFPFEVNPNIPSLVFSDELGLMNDRDWRLGQWNQYKEDYDKNSEIDAIDWGQGYWLWTKNSGNIGAHGISVAPDIICDGIRHTSIALLPGWNQISTPFAFDVSWLSCSTTNELIEDPQKYISGFGYDAEYDIADVLRPFQGYWIYNYSMQAETLFVPYQRYIAESRKKETDKNIWQVRLILESGSALDRNNIIGFRPDAQEGYDKYDISEPPPIGRFVSLAFVETGPDGRRCNLTHNIKPVSSDGWQYDIRVCGNTGEAVELKIESQSIPSGYYVIFEDPISHNRYDLLLEKTLLLPQIPTETGSQYRLFIGSSEYLKNENVTLLAKPGDFRIQQNYPNPFNAITTINYELPKTSHVRLSIYNILGQQVKTLIDVTQPHGYYSITWDGTNDNGQVVASGIYYFRLDTGEYSKARKLLLLK